MANTEKFLNSSGLSSLWAKIKSKFYTKTEVDALIPEDEVMWVTITGSDAPFSVDKTFDEIYNHVHNGGVVYADWDGYLYAPLSYDLSNLIIEFGGCDITDDGIIGDYFYIEKDGSGNTTISRMYVPINASTASPLMDGTVNTGSSMDYARADHVHPSDTSKANVADVLSKTNTTSYTPTGDYHPATKKYVDEHGGNTYALSMNNNVITLTGSDSSTSSATLPVFGGTSADVWEGGVY